MLKKLRILLATLAFCAIVLLFLHPWEGSSAQLGFLAKWQFLPAVLALNLVIIGVLVVITLLFGRIYCSVLCPLGILQDIVGHIGHRKKKYKPAKDNVLRYIVWVIFVASIVAGLNYLIVLLDPYGLFGKMATTASGQAIGTMVPIVAAVAFVIISILAWRNGRTWCNTICPVGTTLGFFSRFSLFRPVIDKEKCKNCHVCEKNCKASCIDISRHSIDASRCVSCFNCLEDCKFGALKYKFALNKHTSSEPADDDKADSQTDKGRRAFLAATAMAATSATLGAQGKKLDGGLAAIIDKEIPEREHPLTPFGSESIDEFYKKCVACQLCITACPNNVLRPSTSLDKLMQPEMGYEKGYCRPECTECSQVCPAGAILPLTPEEKTQFHIGLAKVNRDLCVVEADGVSCGNCARHCPVGAILMVHKDPSDENSPLIPAVDESRCIGCGACEYLCPARPFSAIKVDGIKVHIKE